MGLTSDPRVGSACWLRFGAAAYSTDIYQVWGTALGAGHRTGIAKLGEIPVLAEHKVQWGKCTLTEGREDSMEPLETFCPGKKGPGQ